LSACSAVEAGDYLKVLLAELREKGRYSLVHAPRALEQIPGGLVVDARSLYDFSTRDTGKTPTDRRLAVDLRLLQEYVDRSKWTLRWVSGPQQLADALTKRGSDPTYLLNTLEKGKFMVVRDPQLEKSVQSYGTAVKQLLRDEAATEARKKPETKDQEAKRKARNARKSGNHSRRERHLREEGVHTPARKFYSADGKESPMADHEPEREPEPAVFHALRAGIAFLTEVFPYHP
jgi:hypothetical protein